jgi:tryptophan synthase alpha chain
MADYLKAVEAIRQKTSVPLLLFSYFNPIFQYGLESLARDAHAAGIDAVLVTDITPEEGEEYCTCLETHELDAVFLAAPTSSSERIAKIAKCSRGFVYVVSRTGVTGAQQRLSTAILPTVKLVRNHTPLPVAVGFGISTPEQVRAVWEISDGAVVGSAIVNEIEKVKDPEQLLPGIGEFCRWLTGSERISAASQ